jgi:zinc protease
MKKSVFTFFLALLVGFVAFAQIDRSNPPAPGPAPVIHIGDYHSFTLDNGLKVIVVENSKVPVVSMELTLDIEPVFEGDATGYKDMAGSLLRAGTKSRSKLQIDQEIDFVGASLSTYSTGIYGSSLKKHFSKLTELFTDVLYNPVFPEDELEKLRQQSISGLATIKTNPAAMVGNISSVLLYGAEHPYGSVVTEESVKKISIDKCREYYTTYFRPNVAYLVVVGDITLAEVKAMTDKYFSAWEAADVPKPKYSTPRPPAGNRVAFADRTGAVQSTIRVGYPVDMKPGAPDAIKASVMNGILGGSFSGRLNQNLREDKGYTYGARSSLSNDMLIGSFFASTEVRNSVTDTTLNEIFKEMNLLRTEQVDEDILNLVKNFMTGNFARSLESPRTIAQFALNIERYKLPKDYYATYLERLSKVTAEDVKAMANKYLLPENAYIIIAGNKDEVTETLRPFSANGKIEFYDAFGKKLEEAGIPVPAGMTAQKVINNYVAAIGGAKNLKKVKDVTIKMSATVQGMTIEGLTYRKAPDKFYSSLSMGTNVLQKQVFDGIRGKMSGMGGSQEITGDDLKQLKYQATMNIETLYEKLGFKLELSGIELLDGVKVYKLLVTNPIGKVSTEFYDVETGLKLRTVVTQDTPMGPITAVSDFKNYKAVSGILFPMEMTQSAGPQTITMKVSSVEVNKKLKDDLFIIE